MLKWSPRRILALFLGLWVALAPAIFSAPIFAISVQTNMSDVAGSGGCIACPDGNVAQGVCKLMCQNVVPLATIAEHGKLGVYLGANHEPGQHLALLGRLSTPDPAPPKAVSLL